MGKDTRARRDFAGLRARRMQAAALFARGKTQADVARALGVSRQSASQWHARWKQGGAKALRGAERAGRKPRLTAKELRHLDTALRRGARAHGFVTDLWTLPRVAAAIEKITGIHFHPAHTWRLLQQIGWSLQRPAKRARERNEEGVRRWKARRWPALKKGASPVRVGQPRGAEGPRSAATPGFPWKDRTWEIRLRPPSRPGGLPPGQRRVPCPSWGGFCAAEGEFRTHTNWRRPKKTPSESVPGSSSKTKAGSPSFRPSAAPGLPAARPRF